MTDIIAYLHGYGIPTEQRPSREPTDYLCWGCVGIVVRPAVWNDVRQHYAWRTTPRQNKRGSFGAHVVILDIERSPHTGLYLFDALYPVFYNDGILKTGVTWSPDREPDQSRGFDVLDCEIMATHANHISIITLWRNRISDKLKRGEA